MPVLDNVISDKISQLGHAFNYSNWSVNLIREKQLASYIADVPDTRTCIFSWRNSGFCH